MDKSQAYFTKCCQRFSSRLVHVLVHARTGQNFSRRCSADVDRHDQFSLRIKELSEVTTFLKENVQNYPPISRELTVDFLMCIDSSYLPMESWCVSVSDSGSPLVRSFDMLDHNGESTSIFDSVKFCSDISNLLKSSMAAARATPMFRYFIKQPESERHIVLYRVCEGPPIIDLGEGQHHHHIGTACAPYGNISLDVFYRTEFQTCKTSCCSRDNLKERPLKRQTHLPKRGSDGDAFAFFPFQSVKRQSAVSNATDYCDSETKSGSNACARKSPSLRHPSDSSNKLDSRFVSNGSNNSSVSCDAVPFNEEDFVPNSKSLTIEDPVPFLALLTASCEDTSNHQAVLWDINSISGSQVTAAGSTVSTHFKSSVKMKNTKKLSFVDTTERKPDETIYESAASTIVFSQSENSSGQDGKLSNYSFLSSDDEEEESQGGDNTSETSFIKVPFALLPTGDPSNVGDFILFLRRCEMQEFAFSFDRTDLLIQQLAQFETRRHSFDRFLADITETVEA